MSAYPPIGVANSVSANFQFDPLDAIAYAEQKDFAAIQIYLNREILGNPKLLKKITQTSIKKVYYHAEGYFNSGFEQSAYYRELFAFLDGIENANFIIHFDENAGIDELTRLAEKLAAHPVRIYVENYFQSEGRENAGRNLKKYLAMFTLTSNFGNPLLPVLDLPRLFHSKLGLDEQECMEWCLQMVNFFGNRHIPILLHLIDATSAEQARSSFCALGKGYMPYKEILHFLQKTHPAIEAIILEYEDKLNPLESRDFIRGYLG